MFLLLLHCRSFYFVLKKKKLEKNLEKNPEKYHFSVHLHLSLLATLMVQQQWWYIGMGSQNISWT